MDGADIIIIVLALVFSVVSSIVSAIKKKNKNRQTVSPPSYPQENPWDDILNEVKDIFQGPKAEYKDYSENYDSLEIAGETPLIQEPVMRMAQTRSGKNPVRRSIIEAPQEEMKVYTEPEEQISDVLREFDLRTAVIYSEILKPKFEE